MRKIGRFAVAGAVMGMPALVHAQIGLVITAPQGHAAPALGGPMLLLLAALLGLLAARYLRSRELTVAASLVGLLGLSTAAIAGATFEVTVSGADCTRQAKFPYNSGGFAVLINECPNSIQVISVEPCANDNSTCTETLSEASPIADCEPGTVLPSGESCELPECSSPPECI